MEKRKMTRLSILIPCFNAAEFIAQTLSSIANDIQDNDEVIIVDDGSTDDSKSIATKLLSSLKGNHKVVSNPSKGACSARNHALAISKGAWVQWLDADDILAPGKITQHRNILLKSPASLTVCPFIPFVNNPESNVTIDNKSWEFPTELTNADWLASGVTTIPACWMGHRSTFEKAGPWDVSLKVNQDGEYFARSIAVADKIIFSPNTNVWYRKNITGSVSQFTPEKAESLFASIDSINRTMLNLEDSPRMRQILANKYQHAIYTAYPHFPEGIRRAKSTLQSLPRPNISNPNAVSTLSKMISATFGWKTLTQLRLLRSRFTS